ncbi:MAG TPA: hypothetical protein VJQ56_09860 [Blastocatellia bacterium]|nr:hypothetical protein [Blastocatellia bacterium]
MAKTIFIFSIAVLLLPLGPTALSESNSAGQKIVTASQVNGTWRDKNNIFKVWALGNQKLKVEFLGTYEYKTPAGLMANTGSGSGIAGIEGDTAVFKPDGADDDCKIIMKFATGKLVVEQEGGCGFGHNVIASGSYRKVSARKPRFNED